MLDIKVGEKLLVKKIMSTMGYGYLEKGQVLTYMKSVNLEIGFVRFYVEHNGVTKIMEFSPKYFGYFLCKLGEDPVEFEISLEETQAAYNSVIMTENGYIPKNVIDQFKGPWMQEGKSVSEKETDALFEALEGMNEENYKESAINIALDERDEQKFMELTEGM